jgi:hypothetical protein
VERYWLDRRVVELCEGVALMRELGFTCLPPLDRHTLAWHRFYPPHTRWREAREAPHERFLSALQTAAEAVSTMPGRSREIGGRAFVHVHDYADWNGRKIPREYLAVNAQKRGIPVQRWNDWIKERGKDGKVNLYGVSFTEVKSPLQLREDESIAPHATLKEAEKALELRTNAIRCLDLVASSTGSLTGRQRWILMALAKEGPMGGFDLAAHVRCDRRTLYKSGGVQELIRRGLVSHDVRNGFAITPAGEELIQIP